MAKYWIIGAAVIIFTFAVYMFTKNHEVRPIDGGTPGQINKPLHDVRPPTTPSNP